MTFTYEPGSAADNVTLVRYYTADTNRETMMHSDEEIVMVLAQKTTVAAASESLLKKKIAELIEKKTSMADMKHHFPTIRQLDRYIGIAKTRKPLFFSRGLQALYELEFSSKSSGVDTDVLFDLFQGKVYEKALSSSKSTP